MPTKQRLMSNATPTPPSSNIYQIYFDALITTGSNAFDATLLVVEKYLDGKPARRGKHKITKAERDVAFWSAGFLKDLPIALWETDLLTLALAHYLDQDRISRPELLTQVAANTPFSICKAMRYARMAYQPKPDKISELRLIGQSCPEIHEQCLILDIFSKALDERQLDLEGCKQALQDLTPFELLVYASLYAFRDIIPITFNIETGQHRDQANTETFWHAINELIVWKLKTVPDSKIKLSEQLIGQSLSQHLSPFLFPTPTGPTPRFDLLEAFSRLLAAQIELDEFIARSVDAHCYDEAIRFVRYGNRLEIEETDRSVRDKWIRDGQKLTQLHEYWFYRALHHFLASDAAFQIIGRPENQEANRLAYIRAIRTQLQLDEVYGIDEHVRLESGEHAPIFQTLLSLELTSAFFQQEILQCYIEQLSHSGNWNTALGKLAFDGLANGMQNRFPLTWADRTQKIQSIVGWTVNKQSPQGSLPMAASILDFWTNDWVALASRLRSEAPGLVAEVLERPFLKLGSHFVQLPWITGLQNNSTSAINNLRRMGARRSEAQVETHRIETRLARLFESRNFIVIANKHPDPVVYPDVGEIDLICARDNIVLVIEVKSSFMRRTEREAWLHGTNTLRKAGQQLRRKIDAMMQLLQCDTDLIDILSLKPGWAIHGLIADTSIELDHDRFSCFLKISIEELIIALRDDRQWLTDPDGILRLPSDDRKMEKLDGHTHETLYPDGFNASRFLDVLENELVWQDTLVNDPSPDTVGMGLV